jgi:hypothetical protein
MQITHLRVAGAIAQLDPNKAYPKASSADTVFLHQLSASQRHDQFEPFSHEACELNAWLLSVMAGRELCHDAWDAFMRYNQTLQSFDVSPTAATSQKRQKRRLKYAETTA